MADILSACISVHYLININRSNLETENNDPDEAQDQGSVTIHNVLRSNQIYSDLKGKKGTF